MATCPRCHQYLGDNHRCPRKPVLRRTIIRLAGGLLGGFIGLAVGANLGPPYDVFGVLVGALAGARLTPTGRRR